MCRIFVPKSYLWAVTSKVTRVQTNLEIDMISLRKILMIQISAIVIGQITSCGANDSRNPIRSEDDFQIETNSMALDDGLAAEGARGSLDVAIGSAADASPDLSSSDLSLAGDDESQQGLAWTRTCEEIAEDGSVVVNIEGTRDGSFTRAGRLVSVEQTFSLSQESKRTWHHPENALACSEGGKFIDLTRDADLTGASLQLEFSRESARTVSITRLRSGQSSTRSRRHSAEGRREISWLSHAADSEDGTLVRRSQVDNLVNRTHEIANTLGEEKVMNLSVSTKEGMPLVIETVRDSATGALRSKKIESGTLVTSRTGDARLETTLVDVVMQFEEGSCQVASGVITFSFFRALEVTADSAESEAARVLVLTIADGDYELVDQSSNEVLEDFDFDGCQISDFSRE